MYDVVIVGGGPAGLVSAVYALRGGRSVVVIEKNSFGGQIAFSPKVENIPGTIQISGAEFADKLVEQVVNLGADLELEKVTEIKKEDGIFRVSTEDGNVFEGKTVILALGVKHRMLGLEGEEELVGNGISFCAVCDGAFYTGQHAAMIGGGNSALQEALLLSEVCSKVTIVQNLADFTGEKKLAQAIAEKDNVEVYFSTVVDSYLTRDGALTGLRLKNDVTGELFEIAVDGAFLAVGLQPENEPFAEFAKLNAWGYFDSAEDCLTDTEGLFVAGDCRSKRIRQVTTAAGDGAIAAMAACMYLDQNA
ncbi:MAG: FAD-dependent oxidoreductase [Oscillospiraceae bacterium]|nr:FAD-dependent oxidoreductase [Oscillospiraceae bacterium]